VEKPFFKKYDIKNYSVGLTAARFFVLVLVVAEFISTRFRLLAGRVSGTGEPLVGAKTLSLEVRLLELLLASMSMCFKRFEGRFSGTGERLADLEALSLDVQLLEFSSFGLFVGRVSGAERRLLGFEVLSLEVEHFVNDFEDSWRTLSLVPSMLAERDRPDLLREDALSFRSSFFDLLFVEPTELSRLRYVLMRPYVLFSVRIRGSFTSFVTRLGTSSSSNLILFWLTAKGSSSASETL
jgi:hypothetical protein